MDSDRSARLREARDLLGQAAGDPCPSVRAVAVETVAAGWPGDPATLTVLHRAAGDDDGRVRAAGVAACAQAFPAHPRTLPLLHRAFNDDAGQVRASAVTAIVQACADLTDPDPAVRAAAAERAGAGWPEHPNTHPLLRRAVYDSDSRVRQAAIRALGQVALHRPGGRPRQSDSWPGRRPSWTRHGE